MPTPDDAAWPGVHVLGGCAEIPFVVAYGSAPRVAGECCPGLTHAPECCGHRAFTGDELAEVCDRCASTCGACHPSTPPTAAPSTAAPSPAPSDAANSCEYARDLECDEPAYCDAGTDTADCARPTAAPMTAAPTTNRAAARGPRALPLAAVAVALAGALLIC